MEEAVAHRGFRLAFHAKNIHTAAMILLLLIGMLAAEDSVTKADQVLVVKSQRTLTLLSHGKLLRTYKVALGGSPVGAKEQQGDHKTPEGHYILDRRNEPLLQKRSNRVRKPLRLIPADGHRAIGRM